MATKNTFVQCGRVNWLLMIISITAAISQYQNGKVLRNRCNHYNGYGIVINKLMYLIRMATNIIWLLFYDIVLKSIPVHLMKIIALYAHSSIERVQALTGGIHLIDITLYHVCNCLFLIYHYLCFYIDLVMCNVFTYINRDRNGLIMQFEEGVK